MVILDAQDSVVAIRCANETFDKGQREYISNTLNGVWPKPPIVMGKNAVEGWETKYSSVKLGTVHKYNTHVSPI